MLHLCYVLGCSHLCHGAFLKGWHFTCVTCKTRQFCFPQRRRGKANCFKTKMCYVLMVFQMLRPHGIPDVASSWYSRYCVLTIFQMLRPYGIPGVASLWYSRCCVLMVFQILCPYGIVDIVSSWYSRCCVLMVFQMLRPHGIVDVESSWYARC